MNFFAKNSERDVETRKENVNGTHRYWKVFCSLNYAARFKACALIFKQLFLFGLFTFEKHRFFYEEFDSFVYIK